MGQESTFLKKLKRGLFMTHTEVIERVRESFEPSLGIDRSVLDALEEGLLGADVGAEMTMEIMDEMEEKVRRKEIVTVDDLSRALRVETERMIPEDVRQQHLELTTHRPFVILVVGVNGTGKTTTIAKLARRWKEDGKSVLIGAADTFRAAAIEQLQMWADRVGAPVIAHKAGADPGAVAHDTIAAAKSRNSEVVLIDTAGRLHNKKHLMEELSKIRRVIGKELPGAPHATLLVLDGTTGQNGLSQANAFIESGGVTGIVVTKLDGTAKGGVILSIMRQFRIPVYYIGVGEGMDDLIPFDPHEYIETLFESEQIAPA